MRAQQCVAMHRDNIAYQQVLDHIVDSRIPWQSSQRLFFLPLSLSLSISNLHRIVLRLLLFGWFANTNANSYRSQVSKRITESTLANPKYNLLDLLDKKNYCLKTRISLPKMTLILLLL